MKKFFLLSLCLFLIPAYAFSSRSLNKLQEEAISLKLHKTLKWKRLIHYKKAFFGGLESEADGKGFFMHQDGKSDPEAELRATLEAFFRPQDIKQPDQHAFCKFPSRYSFLKKHLPSLSSIQESYQCPQYKSYIERHNGQSATVVFSSYHLDSPASAFGHTLLRVNKGANARTGKYHELLDFGINYAANMTTDNPVLYTILGMTGGFKGVFSSVPYYYKIREYNDFESRDLWSYNLNITKAEVDDLMDHLWELGQTYFDYYYLFENCSYHILTALEAVNTDWDLTGSLPPWVIPVDTIKALYRVPGLVKSVDYRPSIRTKFDHRYKYLDADGRAALKKYIKSRDPHLVAKNLSKADKVRLWDASIDYLDYEYGSQILIKGGEATKWKQKLLAARSSLPILDSVPRLETPELKKPHLAHDSNRIFVDGGASDGDGVNRIEMRFALHDLLDPVAGQPYFGQIEFGKIQLRQNWDKKETWLENLSLIEIKSLKPWHDLSKGISIRAKIGAETIRDSESCGNCFAPNLEVGVGWAQYFDLSIPITFYNYLDFDMATDASFHRSHMKLSIGPQSNLRFHWSDRWITNLNSKVATVPTEAVDKTFFQYGQETRYNYSNNLAFRIVNEKIENDWDHLAGAAFYF